MRGGPWELQGPSVDSPFNFSSAHVEGQVYILICCEDSLQETERECSYFSAVYSLPRGSTSLPFQSAKGVLMFPSLSQAASYSRLIGNISRSTQCHCWQPTSPLYATGLFNTWMMKKSELCDRKIGNVPCQTYCAGILGMWMKLTIASWLSANNFYQCTLKSWALQNSSWWWSKGNVFILYANDLNVSS